MGKSRSPQPWSWGLLFPVQVDQLQQPLQGAGGGGHFLAVVMASDLSMCYGAKVVSADSPGVTQWDTSFGNKSHMY